MMSTDPDIRREEQIADEHAESLDPALRAWAELNRAWLAAPDPLEDPDEDIDWWLDYLNGPQAPGNDGSGRDDGTVDDDLRECSGCGDRVAYLSSRDLCDGCESGDDEAAEAVARAWMFGE